MIQMLALVGVFAFDHSYAVYASVLRAHVRPTGVNYAALKADRAGLDEAIAALNSPAAGAEASWSRDERLAFWINAYNMLTLRAIVDHYPIQSRWLTLAPRNSIRQIDGVWTTLRWQVAGRSVTLDDIEHRIVRPLFLEPRIHFALNCASKSCPALALQPYLAERLGTQLDAAARGFLATAEGASLTGATLGVSSVFKWYGEDFVAEYASHIPGDRPEREARSSGSSRSMAPPQLPPRRGRAPGASASSITTGP